MEARRDGETGGVDGGTEGRRDAEREQLGGAAAHTRASECGEEGGTGDIRVLVCVRERKRELQREKGRWGEGESDESG